MNIEEVKDRLTKIANANCDDAQAHILEDELYSDFVAFVASGEYAHLSDMAKLILTSKDIDFERWYA